MYITEILCNILLYTARTSLANTDYDDTDEPSNVKGTKTFCRERNRLISGEKDEVFNLVESKIGENVMLQCHFCKENSDAHPQNWFKLDRLDDSKIIEVELGTENNMSLNRLHVNMENSLLIHNITEEDAGEYFCKRLDSEVEITNLLNFYIDVVLKTTIEPEKGNMSAWKKYHDEQFLPINKAMSTSSEPDYVYLKKMNISLEIVTEWDTEGPCEVCGRPKGDGRIYKTGHCRLKILSPSTFLTKNYNEKLLLRATHLSCRSLALKGIIPDVINKTKNIPDFINIEPCSGICNPDAEGVYKGWKSTKKKGYKYHKTFVLAENAHLTLICPESSLESQIVWRINGKVIKPGESVISSSSKMEPRVTLDTFNTLYLYGVTKDEDGNYTCQVDGVRMQQFRVFVVSKAKLLTQAFVRHMMYLAFILSLTLSCYCAGLVITWTRRKKFKSYQQIRSELKQHNRLFDSSSSEESITLYQKDEKTFSKKSKNYKSKEINENNEFSAKESSTDDESITLYDKRASKSVKFNENEFSREESSTEKDKNEKIEITNEKSKGPNTKYKTKKISKSSKVKSIKPKTGESNSTSPQRDLTSSESSL